MAVFTEGESDRSAWSVSDWASAWRAIEAAYAEQDDDSLPLAWVLIVTEGWGPITVLRVMDRIMWSAVAEDWRGLRDYVQACELTADPLLEPFA